MGDEIRNTVTGLDLSGYLPDMLKLPICPKCHKTDDTQGLRPGTFCCTVCSIEWSIGSVRPYGGPYKNILI